MLLCLNSEQTQLIEMPAMCAISSHNLENNENNLNPLHFVNKHQIEIRANSNSETEERHLSMQINGIRPLNTWYFFNIRFC